MSSRTTRSLPKLIRNAIIFALCLCFTGVTSTETGNLSAAAAAVGDALSILSRAAPITRPLAGKWERDVSAPPNRPGFCSALLNGTVYACDRDASTTKVAPQRFKYSGFARTWTSDEARAMLGNISICLVGDSLTRQLVIQLVCFLTPRPLVDEDVNKGCNRNDIAINVPRRRIAVGNATITFAPFPTLPALEDLDSRNAWYRKLQQVCPAKTTSAVVLGIGAWHASQKPQNEPIALDEYSRRLDFALDKFAGSRRNRPMFPYARLIFKPTLPIANIATLTGFCLQTRGSNIVPSFANEEPSSLPNELLTDPTNWTTTARAMNMIVDGLVKQKPRWELMGGLYGEELFGAALSHPCVHLWRSIEHTCSRGGSSSSVERGDKPSITMGRVIDDPVHFCQPDDGYGSPVMAFSVNSLLDVLTGGSGAAGAGGGGHSLRNRRLHHRLGLRRPAIEAGSGGVEEPGPVA